LKVSEPWPGKKIKFEEEAISEILDADTDSESGAEASDIEHYFEEEEENNNKTAAASLSRSQTTDRNK
jgi:hypothetical protein